MFEKKTHRPNSSLSLPPPLPSSTPPPPPVQLAFVTAILAALVALASATNGTQQLVDELSNGVRAAGDAKANAALSSPAFAALNATFQAKAAAKTAAERAALNATFSSPAFAAVNATFPRLTAAKLSAIKRIYEDKLQCKPNPPLLFVPGLFGSYLAITVTAAACAAIPQCVAVQAKDPAFVSRLVSGPPVVINDFFGRPLTGIPERAALLVALLTQTFDSARNRLDYFPGVKVASNGTAAGSFCNGVSKTYVDGIIDGYFVKQLRYSIGSTLACVSYNWELDMPGLQQDGSFALFERQVRELYLSPANDPPMPFMPRRKVVVVGHSMGTLFSTSALQAAPAEVRAMVDQVVLLSPVSAGSALTWQLTLDGGFEPALAFKTVLPEGLLPAELVAVLEPLRFFLWNLAHIGAVNPTLAPYDLPPYQFRRLRPPEFPDGFPAGQSVAIATDLASGAQQADVTVASQAAAVQGPLFRTANGTSLLSFINSIWARSHSYDATVQFWSGASAPVNVTVQCAYGVSVKAILTTAAKVPFPFPDDKAAGFKLVAREPRLEAESLGDGIVNLQGSNGCNRMADNTGGEVFPCTSSDCEHIKIVENGLGARELLDRVMTAAGVNVHPKKWAPLCVGVNTAQQQQVG